MYLTVNVDCNRIAYKGIIMATTDKNKITEAAHIRNLRPYNSVIKDMSDETIDELINQGSLQASSIFEHAIAQTNGKITVVSKNTHDLSDFSDGKLITSRLHDKLGAYSAPIRKFKGKIGPLRVQCLERILCKCYYFYIPYEVYKDKSHIEIPFNRDGTPNRQATFQGVNWWAYELPTFTEMAKADLDPVAKRAQDNENRIKALFSFKEKTGGKVKGILSMTPNAIRKRAQRAAKREA